MQPDQLRRQIGEPLVAALSPTALHNEVLALDVPEVVHPLPEGIKIWRRSDRWAARPEHTDAGLLCHSLRVAAERQREETKDERDEERQHCHWSTSSAWNRSVGGSVRPRDLAVVRLTMNSNLWARST